VVDIWLQVENRPWDLVPGHLDRMTGHHFPHVPVTIESPVTGVSRTPNMHKPLGEDALIIRRYTENWAAPDDRKVNPWDLNEPDPTDKGTMGTIPGATIECSVGESVTVHFRNADTRAGKSAEQRAHSLHPHGFVFEPTSDGAYPLSPPDPTQPIPPGDPEEPLWSALGVTGLKKGDRVPAPPAPGDVGGTFTYTWNTHRWPSTAGVWLYHDHSICDSTNVDLGALGIIVIHNSADPDDVVVDPDDLPGGSVNGSPVRLVGVQLPDDIRVLPGDLEGLGAVRGLPPELEVDAGSEPPVRERLIGRDNLLLEVAADLQRFARVGLKVFRDPPRRAQYLVLIHEMTGGLMCINGRQFLGNTPTLVAGPETVMRFGVVGMGSGQHTFHLHGHRWVIPGPDGTDPGTIQSSPQVRAVSQFEDTRIFGPANSFSFTIRENAGSFMGAFPGTAIGEWHMHCHVLSHMMSGMMGSLLVVPGGNLSLPLPEGVACPGHEVPTGGTGHGEHEPPFEIGINGFTFAPASVLAGKNVRWRNNDPDVHTIIWDSAGSPPSITTPIPPGAVSAEVTMPITAGTFNYHCGIHPGMLGSITVT
jgi:plastocyanin